jgi:RNA polymerase sigma factor (sigma-70 family)
LIINTSLRLGLSEAESEDVAQTTWLRLLENVHRLRVDAALPGWLVTTSRREAWALVRRRNREIPTPDQVDMAAGRFDDDVEEAIDHGRRLEAVRRATSALPERERSLVELLLHQDGHSYAQICERVGMPVGAIGPVRQRAVARLRTLLDVDVA